MIDHSERESTVSHSLSLWIRVSVGVADVRVKAADEAVTESPALVFICTVQTGISSCARLHLQLSLLEINRWRRSFVGQSAELLHLVKGHHALLLDTHRVDPRRRFPLWISRQGNRFILFISCADVFH